MGGGEGGSENCLCRERKKRCGQSGCCPCSLIPSNITFQHPGRLQAEAHLHSPGPELVGWWLGWEGGGTFWNRPDRVTSGFW